MRATYDAGRINCISPSNAVSFVSFEVSIDGAFSFTSSGFNYEFRKVTVTHLDPQHGPALGGTMVALTGFNFEPPCTGCAHMHGSAWCKFDEHSLVPAMYDSSSRIYCRTPAVDVAASVHVRLIINGAEITSGPSFLFQATPVLNSVSPAIILNTGGTAVMLYGRNIGRCNKPMCRFSEICLLYTSPSPRDRQKSRMPSSA